MKKVDLFWMSNPAWWYVEDLTYHIKEDAPEEAKDSFYRYLKQIEHED